MRKQRLSQVQTTLNSGLQFYQGVEIDLRFSLSLAQERTGPLQVYISRVFQQN